MSMQFSECLLIAGMPRRICGFKNDGDIYFYNRSLLRWLSLDGGVKGAVRSTFFNNQVVYSGFLPEGTLIAKLTSGKFGKWSETSWGYEIIFDTEDHPLWI
ncbi:TPA: hypothetical protein ACUNCG_004444 [Aeromonas hydrophila]|uniref:hypothetical protein n=1 Tax=Aeromonas hydrophila TaxID=644 RepID=UPI002F41854B